MRRLLIIYSLVLLGLSLNAQVWRPLGKGLTSTPTALTSINQVIVTASIIETKGSLRSHVIQVWNGYYWQSLPTIYTDSLGYITSLSFFKGDLYIGGKFNHINHIDSSKNIVRWKDRKIEAIPEIHRKVTSFSYVDGLSVYGNRLLIYGPLKNTSSVNGDDLIAYNGNEIVPMPVSFGSGILGNITYINSTETDFLVIGGRYSKVNGQASSKLAYYKNNQWTRITNNPMVPQKIAVYNGDIFFFGNPLSSSQTGFYKVSGTGIDTIESGISEISKIYDLIQIEGELYATGIFKMSNDVQNESRLIKFKNGSWEPVKNGSLLGINKLLNYEGTLISTGFFKTFATVDLNHIAQYVPNAGIVTGRVFFDKDKNCTFNNRDEQLNVMAVQVLPENIILRPNDNGRFFVILEEGNHTFKILTRKYWYASDCNDGEMKISVSKGQINDSANFAMLQYLGKNDLSVNLSSSSGLAALKNRHNAYQIDITNKGSSDVAATEVVLKFDSKLKGLVAKPTPNKVEGDSAVWIISDFYSGEARQINCEFELDASTNTTINLEASIALQDNEEETGDNSSSLTQYLEEGDFEFKKQVFPSESGDTAYLTDTADKVQYQISFANYTSDTIRNVYVVDTIGLNHSLTHVKELGASHPYSIQIFSGQPGTNIGIIVYTFTNINLPPNPSKNPEIVNNRGYVSFEIGLNSSLTEGITLTNKADVTFDYFDPEQTNWVYAIVNNEMVSVEEFPAVNEVKIYPNPTSNQLTLDLPLNHEDIEYHIYNLAGQDVLNGSLKTPVLTVEQLPAGLFFIKIKQGDEHYKSKFIKY
jgi:hypothetical protein